MTAERGRRAKILQVARLTPRFEELLAARYRVCPLWAQADRDAFLRDRGGEFEIVVTTAPVGASAALLAQLPNLKAIVSRGVGLETIALSEARARHIAVSNTPDVLNGCVADAAFGALIAVARELVAADRFLRRGDWSRGRYPLTTRVHGKRLGILGLGAIGRTIARRASGFDMEIRYHNRSAVADVPYTYEATPCSLARWADFLVVSCTGGPHTRGLVSAEVLSALGAGGYLVNVSRGSVVDERALIEALVDKRIAGAALDVYENEPHVPDALLALDNVVLLPHLASNSRETLGAMEALLLDNLRRFLADGQLVTPVP